LFDGYIISIFGSHDRDKITMPKLIAALLRKKRSFWSFCDFITENKFFFGYTVIKQSETGCNFRDLQQGMWRQQNIIPLRA